MSRVIEGLTKAWMWMKAARSRTYSPASRAPLPAFESVHQIDRYLDDNFIYTGDKLGGLDDRYDHPELVNHWIVFNLLKQKYGQSREWPLKVDCDDVSAFVYLASKKLKGFKSAQMYVFRYTYLSDALKDFFGPLVCFQLPYLYFHEGCLVKTEGGTYIVDPNGVQPVADEWEAAQHLGKLYGKRYSPLAVAYPFEE